MNSLGAAVNWAAAILAIIVLVAAALAVARASFAKAQIDALRQDRDDLTVRVQRLESELRAAEVALQTESNKVLALEKVVTGREQLEGLSVALATHDARSARMEIILDSLKARFLA